MSAITTTSTARRASVYALVVKVSWALLFLTLPVTSFPYLPSVIGGGALVRPLSMFPLFVLVFLVTLPRLFTGPVPKTVLALLPFVVVVVVSALLSLLRGVEPSLGIPVTDRILRALLTLAIGCAIYLTVSLLPRSLEDLRFSLRWMYAGFGVALLWGSLQAIYVIHFTPGWYRFMDTLQHYISIRRLIHNRVSGMTYEPNWFAEQISLLLLPWLLASIFSGSTIFRWRWKWLTIEWVLLLWSVALLPFTFSRAGVINLAVLAVVSVLFFRPKGTTKPNLDRAPRWRISKLAQRLIEVTMAIAVLAALIYYAGTKNEFFARLWGYWEKSNPTLEGYFEYLGFGARFTYSETAFRTYEAYPLFGVGPGNYAFYFDEMLPERPLANTPEVLRLVTPEEGRDRLITPKNFYFRVLAETGIVGAITFIAFLIAILGCALYLWLSPDPQVRFWGTGGLLGLIVFVLSAVSFDSFAIPNMWVLFGLITAATWVFTSASSKDQENLAYLDS